MIKINNLYIPFIFKNGVKYSIMNGKKRKQFDLFEDFFEWSMCHKSCHKIDGYIAFEDGLQKVITLS